MVQWIKDNAARCKYIDSHCHLDKLFNEEGYFGTFEEYRRRQAADFPPTLTGCIANFWDPNTWECFGEALRGLLSEEGVWGAVGCHPKNAHRFTAARCRWVQSKASNKSGKWSYIMAHTTLTAINRPCHEEFGQHRYINCCYGLSSQVRSVKSTAPSSAGLATKSSGSSQKLHMLLVQY